MAFILNKEAKTWFEITKVEMNKVLVDLLSKEGHGSWNVLELKEKEGDSSYWVLEVKAV